MKKQSSDTHMVNSVDIQIIPKWSLEYNLGSQ